MNILLRGSQDMYRRKRFICLVQVPFLRQWRNLIQTESDPRTNIIVALIFLRGLVGWDHFEQ
jgi:hypothetical protein